MTNKRLQARARRAARDALLQSGAAAMTIALRAPALLAPFPSPPQMRERRRMVDEKVAATLEGAGDAQAALGAFWIKAMFGGVRGPADLLNGWAEVVEAAARPARRRVRANASRLAKARS